MSPGFFSGFSFSQQSITCQYVVVGGETYVSDIVENIKHIACLNKRIVREKNHGGRMGD